MAGGEAGTDAAGSLQFTPSWALATVCFVFISISLFAEHLIHLFSKWLKRRRKVSLLEAVERLKTVLVLLGFMSLILTVTQRPVSKICVSTAVGFTMLPCRKILDPTTIKAVEADQGSGSAGSSSDDYCVSQGKTSLISQVGMNQLNNFIFVLAVMQIVYSLLTMALGRAKMRRWKAWEEETQTLDYQVANDPHRFRITRQTTFGRRHVDPCTTTSSILLWIKCFCRQFFNSVAKVDYLTLRHGFISGHLSANNSFNFQKHIERSLDDDFKLVVGISPLMWFVVVIFILVDVHGWNAYLWVSFIPIIIVLSLGTKLEVIVAKLAIKLQDQNTVIKGAPLVQPSDDLFWFSHPRFVLTLLHFTLFMNSFELAFFIWVTFQYGIKSCYHERKVIIATRVVLAVTVQVMCSYITLPLYALVTQMGSQFKTAPLEEGTVNAIKKWHAGVKKKKKERGKQHVDPSQSDRSLVDASSQMESSVKSTNTEGHSSHNKGSPYHSHRTEITEDFPPISHGGGGVGGGGEISPRPSDFLQITLN